MVAKKMGSGSVDSGPAAAVLGAIAVATPVLVLGGTPVWQEARRIVCRLAADSAERVATARTTMDTAVADVRFEEQLRNRLAAELTQKAPAVPQVPYRRDARTILEIMAYEPSITGREGTNPGLALHLGLRVRLLAARTQAELYYDYLDYRSATHTLVEWAADDARIFRAELERCLAQLSAEIVAQLFVRASAEIVDSDGLAALGISRRPPQLLASSGGTLWSPPFKPAVFARR
jgi:hypothetical protein